MLPQAAADHYLQERLATASPGELVVMLYDKAVLSLQRARGYLATGERDAAWGRIANATDIVLELRCALNPAAGDVTTNLDALYGWVLERLFAARRDPAGIDDALAVLEPLRSAWRDACRLVAAAPAPVPAG